MFSLKWSGHRIWYSVWSFAKQQYSQCIPPTDLKPQPCFKDQLIEWIVCLKSYRIDLFTDLMQISLVLAELNDKRFQSFNDEWCWIISMSSSCMTVLLKLFCFCRRPCDANNWIKWQNMYTLAEAVSRDTAIRRLATNLLNTASPERDSTTLKQANPTAQNLHCFDVLCPEPQLFRRMPLG